MKTNLDGSIEYHAKDGDVFQDVILNGFSVANLIVTDIKQYPDGYGFVVTRKRYGDEAKVLKLYHDTRFSIAPDAQSFYYIDGPNIPANFFYYGQIEVTL